MEIGDTAPNHLHQLRRVMANVAVEDANLKYQI